MTEQKFLREKATQINLDLHCISHIEAEELLYKGKVVFLISDNGYFINLERNFIGFNII